MSNASDVIAALCAKAADVAFASKISEAASTFKMLEPEDDSEMEKHATVQKFCSKASAFRRDELSSKTPTSPLPEAVQIKKLERALDIATMAGGNGGKPQHSVSKMDLQEILSLTKSFVTIPSGGQKHHAQHAADPMVPPPLPTNVITRRASISSTTSSLTDLDYPNQSDLDAVLDNPNVLDSLKLDDLIIALRKKVADSPKQDSLTSDVVVALANALSSSANEPNRPIMRRNSCIATQNFGGKASSGKASNRRRESSQSNLKKSSRRGRRSGSVSFDTESGKCGGQDDHTGRPGTTKRLSFSDSPHGVSDPRSNQLRRSSMCSRSTMHAGSCGANEGNIPDDDELLAHGWRKAMDVSTGQFYFYTLDRSKVVWNNPLEKFTTHEEEMFTMPGDQDFFLHDSFTNSDFADTNPFKVVYSGSQRKA